MNNQSATDAPTEMPTAKEIETTVYGVKRPAKQSVKPWTTRRPLNPLSRF